MLTSGDVCAFCRLTERLLGKPMGLDVRSYIKRVSANMKLS
jgi:hypothetical protein